MPRLWPAILYKFAVKCPETKGTLSSGSGGECPLYHSIPRGPSNKLRTCGRNLHTSSKPRPRKLESRLVRRQPASEPSRWKVVSTLPAEGLTNASCCEEKRARGNHLVLYCRTIAKIYSTQSLRSGIGASVPAHSTDAAAPVDKFILVTISRRVGRNLSLRCTRV